MMGKIYEGMEQVEQVRAGLIELANLLVGPEPETQRALREFGEARDALIEAIAEALFVPILDWLTRILVRIGGK